jgi:hypothetical protein
LGEKASKPNTSDTAAPRARAAPAPISGVGRRSQAPESVHVFDLEKPSVPTTAAELDSNTLFTKENPTNRSI